MYRPQFAIPLPSPPCEDQSCMYSFDGTNTPAFSGSLQPLAQTGRIPLHLDKNADFYLLAVSTDLPVSLRIEDGKSNPLSDSENTLQAQNFENPNLYSATEGAGFAVLESGADGVLGRQGGNFSLYLYNPTAAPVDISTCVVNLIGRKRYPGALCAA